MFAETASDERIEDLARQHRDIAERVQRDGLSDALVAEVEELEGVLHGSIVATLQNGLIDSSYRRIHNYIRILRLDRRLTAPLVLRSLREHMAIIEACRMRNTAAAVAALRAHFDAALQRSLGLYRYGIPSEQQAVDEALAGGGS